MIKIKRRPVTERDGNEEETNEQTNEPKQLSAESKELLEHLAGHGPKEAKVVQGMTPGDVVEDVEDQEKIREIGNPILKGKRKLLVPLVKDLMSRPSFMLSLGASRSGKTYALKSLMSLLIHKKKFFKRGLVFEGSKGLNDDWAWLPDSCRLGKYSEIMMQLILDKLTSEKEKLPEGKNSPPMFLIFDDCLGQLIKSAMFENFLAIYRHYNIWVFINNQYMNTGIPIMRAQTTHAVLYDSDQGVKGYYEAFGKRYSHKFDEFHEMFRKVVAQPHTALLFVAGQPADNNYVSFSMPAGFEPIPVYFNIRDTHRGKPHPKLQQIKEKPLDSDNDSDFDDDD